MFRSLSLTIHVVYVSIEKLAKTDKVTVSLEALPEGKIRANTSASGDAKVLLRNEVLEVQVIDGQLRLACKERFHDDGDPPVVVVGCATLGGFFFGDLPALIPPSCGG